ncbi:MAG: glycosyltransferase family 2 protein [Aureisphaera sp.]
MPLYNKETFIGETISSVLGQNMADFELIIVNDGSTDDSMKVVNSYTDKRLKVLNIERSGVSVARNLGMKNAQFEWIAFLDADDWWAPEFLEEMVQAIHAYPTHDLFASGRTRVFCNREERYENPLLPQDGECKPLNFYKVISQYLPPINSSNSILNKKCIDNVAAFTEGQKMHEDHDLWMRLCVDKEVVFLNKNLSFYRNTEEDSASKQYYEPLDFCIYLTTLGKVKKIISNKEMSYFNRYCNRFILINYIKNYSHYSREEDDLVYEKARGLLQGFHALTMSVLRKLPYKNTYPLFKMLKI